MLNVFNYVTDQIRKLNNKINNSLLYPEFLNMNK
jgi:hypothetical protein